MESFETERLRFREWRESDAEDLFVCASDPDVGERAGWPPHKTVDDFKDGIIRNIRIILVAAWTRNTQVEQ